LLIDEVDATPEQMVRIVACVNACKGIPNVQLECDEPTFVRIFNERNRLAETESNLRGNISHLYLEIAGAKSNVEFIAKQRDELLAALVNARNCLESANEMGDGPIVDTIWYGRAETLFDYMDNAIASVKGNHSEQPLDMVETTAPAIVFYPAGSLGEEVQP
jgi:hypothetical protein